MKFDKSFRHTLHSARVHDYTTLCTQGLDYHGAVYTCTIVTLQHFTSHSQFKELAGIIRYIEEQLRLSLLVVVRVKSDLCRLELSSRYFRFEENI